MRYFYGSLVTAVPGQPPGASGMWNLARINWFKAMEQMNGIDPVRIKIAVLDTGVDRAHDDLQQIQRDNYHFSYKGLVLKATEKDIPGHGTHVCGTIAARAGGGVQGICGCTIMVLKVASDEPFLIADENLFTFEAIDTAMYLRALRQCLREKPDVINLSFGGPGEPTRREKQIISRLIGRGVVVIAAMGNERALNSPVSYPAALPDVIAVGATNSDDSVCDFSNSGDHITLCAPGEKIWSTLPKYPGQHGYDAKDENGSLTPDTTKPYTRGTTYAEWRGTSMSCPHVTAAVALLLAKKGKMSPNSVKELLKKTADPVPGMQRSSFTPDYGAGRLNLLKLLQ